jgi:ribonuclease P protein component
MSDEAHFSAEQSGTRASARLSRPDGDGRRTRSDPRTPRPRPQEAVGLVTPDAESPGSVTSARAITTISARKDFLAANQARRAPSSGFVLLARTRGDGDDTMRLGITVTKKIGNAVVRNRMKRRFRALAREILPQRGIMGADHILIGRAGGVERDFAALRVELEKALAKVSR